MRVRRCAARTLYTVIRVWGRDLIHNSAAFVRVANALIERFREREAGSMTGEAEEVAALVHELVDVHALD